MEVNGQELEMEIDTGAAVSVISKETQLALFPEAYLSESTLTLRTYTAEPITVLGQMKVKVRYKGYVGTHQLVVVAGKGPALLGRDWLSKIRSDWASIRAIAAEKSTSLSTLLSKYTHVFELGTGTLKRVKAQLTLKEGARPHFCRARPVPFAIKQQVGQELDRLEESGVLCRVDHSDWAAPIVPVPKKDGAIRVCGDNKVTINPALQVDQYPLPKPADLMASLTSGQQFTKLDLTAAYQQVQLDNESMKLVTINTHQGLYQYTHLPFGVASAPAVFQNVHGYGATRNFPCDLLLRRHISHRQVRGRPPSESGGSPKTSTGAWHQAEEGEVPVLAGQGGVPGPLYQQTGSAHFRTEGGCNPSGPITKEHPCAEVVLRVTELLREVSPQLSITSPPSASVASYRTTLEMVQVL